MVFANTIAYKLYRTAFSVKVPKEYPSTEEKQAAYDAFLKWGLCKEHFKNIAFRNLSESVPAEDIMLAQVLKNEKARKSILGFLLQNVNGTKDQPVPDLDIWEQEDDFGMNERGYSTLYEDDSYKVVAMSQNKHSFMRIWHKHH